MSLLRWLIGDQSSPGAGGGFSLGMGEVEAVFNPGKLNHTELIEEQRQSRVDVRVGEGAGDDSTADDLSFGDLGLDPDDAGVEIRRIDLADLGVRTSPGEVQGDESGDGLGDQLDGDGGQQQPGDAGEHLDAAAFDQSHDQ